MNPSLDKFGEFIVKNLRDEILHQLEALLIGKWKTPDRQKLQGQLSSLTDEQKQILRDTVDEVTTSGMAHLLFAIQEHADNDGALKVLFDGQEVAKLSDGLHGEIFGDQGWIVRFSKYPRPEEIEMSKWAKEVIAKWIASKDDNENHGRQP